MKRTRRDPSNLEDLAMQPSYEVKSVSTADAYRVFLVEDDQDLQSALVDYLNHEGYEVDACSDGDSARTMLVESDGYDVVLLDVMLPGCNGFDILRSMRTAGVSSPVIMLTAKGDQKDVLNGFDLGADDYVPKPFNADVLEARIRAILNRSKPPAARPMDVHEFGEMTVNFSSNDVLRRGEPVNFTSLEFDLLRYLINNRQKVVSREQLLRDVWDLPPEVDTRTVDRHIASLRKKIESDREDPRHILTVYGRGYRFEP